MQNQIQKSLSRVNEKGELEEFHFEQWQKVDGYFARAQMVAHLKKAFKGNLMECQSLTALIFPSFKK